MTQPTILTPPTTGTNWTPPGWAPPTEPPAPPTPPAKRKTGWYIAGAIILFFIIIGLASGDDTENASSSSGGATTATTARPTSASAPTSLLAWVTLHGSDDAATLSADLTSLSDAAGASDVAGLGSACRTFQRHLRTATGHLPSPDAELNRHLGAAYGYFTQAATACISGVEDLDPAKLKQVSGYMSLGSGSLSKATARLETLN